MTDASAHLDDLRREIDDIDSRMHDLLMRRAEVVGRVALAKRRGGGTGGPLMRPGREAQVLRRILARHSGTLPGTVIAALWRELMSAFLRLQGPVEVAVSCGADRPGAAGLALWDVARGHFGATTPMTPFDTPAQALRVLAERPGAVAVLPAPGDGVEHWWPLLVSQAPDTPRIIARLPFVRAADEATVPVPAVVVAPFEAEPTGDDLSYIAIGHNGEMSRARLVALMAQAGLEGHLIASATSGPLHLAEVKGHVGAADTRLAALKAAAEGRIDNLVAVGAFAAPIVLAAADPAAAARA
jgi:chorismate mutase-like protein